MIIQRDGGGGDGGGPRRPPPKPGGGGGGGTPPGGGGSPPGKTATPSPTPVLPPILPLSTQLIADAIKGGLTETAPANTIQDFLNVCMSVAAGLSVSWAVPSGATTLQAASSIRSAIVTAMNRGGQVAAIAASRGFLLPDDPMPRFIQINLNRQLFGAVDITQLESNELVGASSDLVRVAAAYDAGTVTFNNHKPASQLASFEFSIDGMTHQTGDPLVDILGYQPDADFIKRKQALNSLAKLDFSRRKPYLLFTADPIVGGKRTGGTIVCWIRMRDASGYLVSKREVFSSTEFAPAALDNATIQASTDALMREPAFLQVLSFYDWVHPGDVVAFVDSSSQVGSLYSYTVSGVQRRAPATQFVFDVPMNSLYLTVSQAQAVRAIIIDELRRLGVEADVDSVSPYPAIAQVVYGDPGYGWILAGCNLLASKRRGDLIDDNRSFSYIGSRASTLLAQASAGRMFAPADIGRIHTSIDEGVASFGISQVILSVLDGVGVTLFSSQKDDPLGFQPTQESLEGATGGLAKILSAIDPGSAILDPKLLAASLATHVNSGGQTRYSPTPILTTDPQTMSTAVRDRNILQPDVTTLEAALGVDVLDLTTYEGISRLLQLIRTVYDFYPGALS